ncbi:MAG: glycerophosphodiester phosphodiesterase family protein [Clostridia bacterium]|nr:glycerophosphodiester phosphodiesterase family protein [Clostridia bacterium]
MYIERLKRNFEILDHKNFISHGGIYGYSELCEREVKQNTVEAISFSIENGIPFECDIRGTKDNIPVLSHDDEVTLSDGRKIKISKTKYADLVEIAGTEAPELLEAALQVNSGRVPCLIDAKEAKFFLYSHYRKNLANILNRYAAMGEIALQSFNPAFMLVMRRHLKGVLTLQLVCRAQTVLDVFKAPKRAANIYEKMVSFVCFIARTDAINMENHEDKRWKFSTRAFHSDEFYNAVEEILDTLTKGTDRIQYFLVKTVNELTKKPVLAFTIKDESEFDAIEGNLISNYIVDFSHLGAENYIDKIKSLKAK